MKIVTVITILYILCIGCCDAGLYWRKIFTDSGCTDESEVGHFYFPNGGGYSCTLGPGCVEIATGQFWAVEDCSNQPVFRNDFIRVTLDTSSASCSSVRSLWTAKPDFCFIFENAGFTNAYRLTGCDENGVVTIAAWNTPDCTGLTIFNYTTSATTCDLVDFGSITGTCVVPPMAPIAPPVNPPIDPPIMDTPINAPINIPVNAPVANNAPKATPVAKKSTSVSIVTSTALIISVMLINML